MYIYRKATSAEKTACIELANYVFSTAHYPHDFETLLPKVYASDKDCAGLHRVAVREDGRIRAEVAVLPERLHVGGEVLNTGFIGTVCVHPKERGMGHMKRLLRDTLKELKTGCDLAVLDGQRQRYEYFGFTKCGVEMDFLLTKTNVRHCLSTSSIEKYSFVKIADFKETHSADEIAAFAKNAERQNRQRLVFAERAAEEIPDILASWYNRTILVYKEKRFFGYLLVTPKGDIAEVTLADESQTAAVLSAYLLTQTDDSLRVRLPLFQRDACRSLQAIAEQAVTSSPESLMCHIFNFEHVLGGYLNAEAALGMLAPGSLSLRIDDCPLTITSDGQSVKIQRKAADDAVHLTHMQAQELLLSNFVAAGLPPASIPDKDWKKLQVPRGWFPLPIFWYPADAF